MDNNTLQDNSTTQDIDMDLTPSTPTHIYIQPTQDPNQQPFKISVAALQRSKLLREALEMDQESTTIQVNDTPFHVEKIIQWLEHYATVDPIIFPDQPLKDTDFKKCVDEWEYNFLDLTYDQAIDLYNSVAYFDIPDMLVFVSAKLASIIEALDSIDKQKEMIYEMRGRLNFDLAWSRLSNVTYKNTIKWYHFSKCSVYRRLSDPSKGMDYLEIMEMLDEARNDTLKGINGRAHNLFESVWFGVSCWLLDPERMVHSDYDWSKGQETKDKNKQTTFL